MQEFVFKFSKRILYVARKTTDQIIELFKITLLVRHIHSVICSKVARDRHRTLEAAFYYTLSPEEDLLLVEDSMVLEQMLCS